MKIHISKFSPENNMKNVKIMHETTSGWSFSSIFQEDIFFQFSIISGVIYNLRKV